jgi:hypothetical protein
MPTENTSTGSNATTPTPTAEQTKTIPTSRAYQDQRLADCIAEAGHLVETVRADAALSSTLRGRGYDTQKLDTGAALQLAAQLAFNARQAALGAQKGATENVNAAESAARQTYADFRETVRAVFPNPADRAKLGAVGKVPQDTQPFITQARASYAAAQTDPYSAVLATYGFAASAVNNAVSGLDQLEAATEARRIAQGAALKATQDRNLACQALCGWVKQFRQIAKVAFRQKPEQRKKLKLAA